MRAFFRSVPRSLVEAARLDGSSSWSTLWRVVLPVGRPAVLTMMVLVFMWTWNEFLLALVMVSDEYAAHRAARARVLLRAQHDRLRAARRRLGDRRHAGRDPLRLPPAPLHPRHALRGGEGVAMASVSFESVTKRFDAVEAVRELTLEAADGEFLVLVGPSGSGKTTALRMLAGLESVSEGEIRIGERVVNRVAPRERDIAMVFQDYALYPQMTVYDNLAFALRRRKTPKERIDEQVRRAAGALELDALLERKPRQLSGGQQQRVALGRALVRDPAGVPDGRAALQPRREAARPDARRDQAAAEGDRDDDGLRHPRPGRGDDDGRPHRGHERRPARAGRHARRALRRARERVRRRLRRLARA